MSMNASSPTETDDIRIHSFEYDTGISQYAITLAITQGSGQIRYYRYPEALFVRLHRDMSQTLDDIREDRQNDRYPRRTRP